MVYRPRAGQPAPNSVGASQLQTDAVTEAKIASNAVSEAKIAAGAVTSGKMGNGAVTTDKLANLAVTSAKVNEAITWKEFFSDDVDQSSYVGGTAAVRMYEFKMVKNSGAKNIQNIVAIFNARRDAGTGTIDLEIYANESEGDWNANDQYTGSGTPLASVTIPAGASGDTLAQYLVDADVSGLANGRHVIALAAKPSDASTGAQIEFVNVREKPADA